MDDFGSQGEWPVHPELLDWLAVEFMESGWDVKALQKTIVMRAAYRQSSRVTPELLQKDPDNRLLARGPRFRLGPEVIRDQALAVSGLLVEKVGGPSVKPYQPAGLVAGTGRRLGLQAGQGRGPLPPQPVHLLEAHRGAAVHDEFRFAESRAVPVFENRTNTPLQALDLMNDVTFLEAARKLAERMMTKAARRRTSASSYGYRLVLARAPDAARRQALLKALERLLGELIATTPAPRASSSSRANRRCVPGSTSAELAAYAGVASLLLNLDETITKE